MPAPRVLTVIGTRPQFIKAAAVSMALEELGLLETLVHTGQHYDAQMSDVFFQELGMRPPDHNLAVGSGSYNFQVGEGLERLEPVIHQEKPNAILVYGDTNATLVGALTGAALHIPVGHVEAGLRSYNRRMPEEINRVTTDHLATWNFAPTKTAVENLRHEGIVDQVYRVGDVMLDAVHIFRDRVAGLSTGESTSFPDRFYLLTMHRAETTARPDAMARLLQVLDSQDLPVIYPVHPRARAIVNELRPFRNIQCTEPLGYLDMLRALGQAKAVITDSGGLQKEAAFHQVPCITLREETEWTETVDAGLNRLVGYCPEKLASALQDLTTFDNKVMDIEACFGGGQARYRIAEVLREACG